MNKSLSKNSLYYFFYNAMNIAFPFITGIYVSRKLTPNAIGSVEAARNLAQYFVILAFLGIPTYGLREIARSRNDEQEKNRIFTELFIINFISTIIFLLFYFLVIHIIPLYRESIILYYITGFEVFLNLFNISWLYSGLEEYRFISLRNLFFKCVSFVLLLAFVRNENDALKYALITVTGTAGNSLLNLLYLPGFASFRFKNLEPFRHLKSIFYLTSVNLAIEIYSLLDVTMMNFFCDKKSIAFYKYGHSIEKILLQVVNTFTMVVIPRLSSYYKQEEINKFNNLLSKTLKIIIIVALPMIVGIWFTSDFLLTNIYGEQYIVSSRILKIFSLLLLISPIGYLLGSRVLLVTGHENNMIYSVMTGAIVNIVGNIILIPRYQETGAAIVSLISEIVVMLIYVLLGKSYFKLSEMDKTLRNVLISIMLMSLYLFLCNGLMREGWIKTGIQILGAVIIYASSLLMLKEDTVCVYFDRFKKKY